MATINKIQRSTISNNYFLSLIIKINFLCSLQKRYKIKKKNKSWDVIAWLRYLMFFISQNYNMEIIIGEREQAWRKLACMEIYMHLHVPENIYESARLFPAFDISPIGAWIPSDISPKCLLVIFAYHCLPTLFKVTSRYNCDCANSWIFLVPLLSCYPC